MLGAERYAKHPCVDTPCVGSAEVGLSGLGLQKAVHMGVCAHGCLWELAVHVGVCARGHGRHPVPTTDSRYKLMGSAGSLVAGYLVLMPKTNFK